ncbi:hypothetical protein SteCoe_14951 [Stentor coeruleus]|uniref:Nucleoside phosphorylase domain-containing protein n=1 Tax=Stentor coeruleus TaxID=5963 RepID=A0A1R2C4U0_9CILI|nr:hypothetical protein SteCoe_14951 [Stentor coeruleus]
MSKALLDANFPRLIDGKTMHLNVLEGDVNPRILSVGDAGRGERISSYLENLQIINSTRGFITYSGTFEGVPVSIIVTGMGIPMMDFVVREATSVISSKVAMIRLGTCGALKPNTKPGSIILASSSRFISQNYSYPVGPAYNLSSKVHSDPDLFTIFKNQLISIFGSENVDEGVDLTCETFYSAQGRKDPRFDDCNENLIENMVVEEPEAAAMEMETFKLLHLASTSKGKIAATACMIGLLNRHTQELMDFSKLHDIERDAARAALMALIRYPLDN